jgi:hypothetical protein
MNGFRKIFPNFLSHYATFFAKMAERKVVPFDEFYYQLKLMHLFQKHPVFSTTPRCFDRAGRAFVCTTPAPPLFTFSCVSIDYYWGNNFTNNGRK